MLNGSATEIEEYSPSGSIPPFREGVRLLLARKGWSAHHACLQAGLTKDQISSWLRGRYPFHRALDALAAALEAPPGWVTVWHAEVAVARPAHLVDRAWRPKPAQRLACIDCGAAFIVSPGKAPRELCARCARRQAASSRPRERDRVRAFCGHCGDPIMLFPHEGKTWRFHKACAYWRRSEQDVNRKNPWVMQLYHCAKKLGPKPNVGNLAALAARAGISVKYLSRLLRSGKDRLLPEATRAKFDRVTRDVLGEPLAYDGPTLEEWRRDRCLNELGLKGIEKVKSMTHEDLEQKIWSKTRDRRNPANSVTMKRLWATRPEALREQVRQLGRRQGKRVTVRLRGHHAKHEKSLGRHLTAEELGRFAGRWAARLGIPKDWILDLLLPRAGLPRAARRPTDPQTIDAEAIIRRRHPHRTQAVWESIADEVRWVWTGRRFDPEDLAERAEFAEYLRRGHWQREAAQRRK